MENKIIDNRYELVRSIGTGGFARVYKAWALNLEKYVALKKIYDCYTDDSNLLESFRKEAVNTARLEHENIVRVIDFVKTNANEYYIVMEYISGRDLEYLTGVAAKKGIKISAELAVHITAEALKALNYAHGRKDELTGKPSAIIHRDVSP